MSSVGRPEAAGFGASAEADAWVAAAFAGSAFGSAIGLAFGSNSAGTGPAFGASAFFVQRGAASYGV